MRTDAQRLASTRAIPLLALVLALAGCANWQTTEATLPSTYDEADAAVPRTVGRLRRLLWLPVVRALPVACKGEAAADDWRFAGDTSGAPMVGSSAGAFTARGYELVERASVAAPIDWAGTIDALRRAVEAGGEEALPESTAALVRSAGNAARVDGIAFVAIAATCELASPAWRVPNWVKNNIFRLGLSHVFGPLPEDLAPTTEAYAAVFETRRGRMVWRSYRYWSPPSPNSPSRPDFLEPDLFRTLEPAVPALLTR